MGLKICEAVKSDLKAYAERGPINVVVCGDSVSHGALGDGEMDYGSVYHNLLRLMINQTWKHIPVNVINTAVGGRCSDHARDNFERDVVPHKPDLVIICFGLNDVNRTLEQWRERLGGLFDKCLAHGLECVYMTPNMLNTYVADGTAERYVDYAHKTAEMQNGGRMDAFMDEARAMAAARGIPVCDCYAKWKALAAEGVDTTMLLANRINHPTREMHGLFAESLFETIFGVPFTGEVPSGEIAAANSGMYKDA